MYNRQHTGPRVEAEQPGLLMLLAALGILGCVCLVVGTLVAQILVPDYDWIAGTISDLAAGRWEIVMDVALYGFAAGVMATALAAAHAHLGRAGWSAGVVALAVLAALVVVIGARNEYGDRDSQEGIHRYLVYGLGLLFALAPLLLSSGIARESQAARRWLIALGVIWIVAAPVFYFLPTDIDGLYERALGLVASAIVCVLCAVFWRRARRAA